MKLKDACCSFLIMFILVLVTPNQAILSQTQEGSQKVVFVTEPDDSSPADTTNKVWLMNGDGSNQKVIYQWPNETSRIMPNTQDSIIEWSRQGDKFFVFPPLGQRFFLVFDREGNLIKRFDIDQEALLGYVRPSWTSDDKLIFGNHWEGVFEYDFQSHKTSHILQSQGYVYELSPTVSPDGTKLAIAHYEWGTLLYLTVFDLTKGDFPISGDNVYQGKINSDILYKETTIAPNISLDILWTLDSRFIITFINAESNERRAIYVIDVKTKEIKNIETRRSFFVDEQGLQLSQSGDKFLYFAAWETEIYVVKLPTLNETRYLSQCSIFGLSWLPDNRKVAIACLRQKGLILLDTENNQREIIPIFLEKGDYYITKVSWSPN